MELSLPETFEAYSDARKAGFLKVKAAKEGGRRVAGTFCTFTPLEILDAAGMLAVSLCGMSAETIPAAEVDLPRNLCPLIKSSYGFYVSDKCPYTYFSDLIVGETTCDGKKKMYELMARGKELFLLHLPVQAVEGSLLLFTQRQRSGRRYGTASAGRFAGTTSRISGMISPAFRILTVSPMRMSLSVMKS